MANEATPRLNRRIVLAFIAVELIVFAWVSHILLVPFGRSAMREPEIIRFVLYHDKHLFHSKCCLNNLLMQVTAGQIQQGCELANKANQTVAVLLPKDLDQGGTLREASNTSFSMYTTRAVEDLKRLARNKLNCILLSEDEIDGAGIPKLYYERPSDHAQMMASKLPLREWTYRNMRLPAALSPVYDLCYGNLTRNGGVLAVHMRIERDWHPYCEKRSQRLDGVDACYSPRQIAESVSTLDYENVVLIHGDMARIYRKEEPQKVWPKVNPRQRTFHKSWSTDCSSALQNLTYNEVALLDFWVSIEAEAFVGTHLSTFSNMVTYVREIRGKMNSSFVYSCPDSPLMLRQDGGILVRNASDRERCYLRTDSEQGTS